MRAERAHAYFSANAESWNELRSLHAPEEVVEAEILRLLGSNPFNALLDLGTGTGRMLALLAGRYRRGLGIDASSDMLAIARAQLDSADIVHASLRKGDIFNLPPCNETFDLVALHQVLHFLHEPGSAIMEAARMINPGGRMLVVDFAPHDHEELRRAHAHVRLGFSRESVCEWLKQAGLEVEKVVELSPDAARPEALTVILWLARDPRLLIAGSSLSSIEAA